ncbi:lysozyme inhibitor LprI family protein [Deinococcus sp. UYEF24]
MKRIFRSAATVVFMAVSLTSFGPAKAQTNCNTPNNSFEDVYCLNKVFVKADDDLNTVYQKLLQKLSPSAQATLRKYQRAWIEQRNADSTGTDSKQGKVIYIDTAVNMTVSRTNFLNDRYRECVSSGCQPNKLR